MAKSQACTVEVGIHPAPHYIRKSDGKPFCRRHAFMMVEEGYNKWSDFEEVE